MTPRLLTPDVARGFMLLLIALANVTAWLPTPRMAEAGTADTTWVLVRSMLVDGRAYPLFSMLFGFGLATIAARYDDVAAAGRMLRRRGGWLIVFGLVHAVVFPGDVLGAYGLTAVVLSALIAKRARQALIALAVFIAVLSAVSFYALTAMFDPAITSELTEAAAPAAMPDIIEMAVWSRITMWLAGTVGTVALTAVLPCVVIGVFIQYSGVLTRPWRHRGLLALTAVVGLAAAALLGLPYARVAVDDSLLLGGDVLHGLGSYPGGLGWLALIALVFASRQPSTPNLSASASSESRPPEPAGSTTPPAADAGVTGRPATQVEPRRAAGLAGALAAIGQRSLTAYLGQTILFAALFYSLHATGALAGITPLEGAAIAVAVWLATGVFCVVLARAGRPGPFEAIQRRLVYGPRREVRAASGEGA